VLITHVLDAEPDHRYVYPGPTPWPFVTAVCTAVMLVSLLFSAWALPIGISVVAIVMTIWVWPTTKKKEGEEPEEGAAEAAA
jgi:membrane protein implicated in regulation of membrane protease activity